MMQRLLMKCSTNNNIHNIVTKRCLRNAIISQQLSSLQNNIVLSQQSQPQPHAVTTTTLRLSYFSTNAVATSNNNNDSELLGVGKYKTSTGLVGLAVEPDWYNVMLKKFQALLDKMEESDMPETAQYRMDVTKWCNYVIATVKANPDSPESVEDAVQMGQVEELIEMADDEMICLDTYLNSRMWELVAATSKPVVDLNPDPMRDPFGTDGNIYEQDAIRKGMEQPVK